MALNMAFFKKVVEPAFRKNFSQWMEVEEEDKKMKEYKKLAKMPNSTATPP